MKSLSSKNNFLFKSFEPIINDVHQLSSTTDLIISKQATKILLSFFIVKGSFKDILALLNKLIFNTTDTYNVQGLIIQLNNNLIEIINESEKEKSDSVQVISLDYLKSIIHILISN